MDVFIGNIMCFAFNFAPSTWIECNGQTLNIANYQTLYTLIGTTFGGNGTTNFCIAPQRVYEVLHCYRRPLSFEELIEVVFNQFKMKLKWTII